MKELEIVELVSEKAIRLWNGWEIRVLVLVSLFLQVFLILFGSELKYKRGIWIKLIVWLSYIAADWVADFALGNLAKIQTKNSSEKKYALQAFWAPFLLLHLGRSDTITGYSLEDNELWLRHLVALYLETGVAIYVIVWSWTYTAVSYTAVAVLLIGFIKYHERIFVLWSGTTHRFKENLLATNTFEDNATKVIIEIKDQSLLERKEMKEDAGEGGTKQLSPHYLVDADSLYKRFRYLFANLILGLNERIYCYSIIDRQPSAQEAFKLVEVELGFLYDELYTKATFIYSGLGLCSRCFIFLSSVTGLVVFSKLAHVHQYHDPIDICVSYLLLGGVVFIEICAFFRLLQSDWTRLWFVKQGKPEKLLNIFKPKREWSQSMAQYNLIDFCLKEIKGMRCDVHKRSCLRKFLEEYWYKTWKPVTDDVLDAIYSQLRDRGRGIKDSYTIRSCKELLAERGDRVLKIYKCNEKFNRYTVEEFDHSLLVWHIATDILYYVDFDQKQTDEVLLRKRKISKHLSNYMLYILVLCPAMLPQGIGEIKYRDTCDEVKSFCKSMPYKREICKVLYENGGIKLEDQPVLPLGQAVLPPGQAVLPPGQSVLGKGIEQSGLPPGQSVLPPGESGLPPERSVLGKGIEQSELPPEQSVLPPAQSGLPPGQSVLGKGIEQSGLPPGQSVLGKGIELAKELQFLESREKWDRKRKWEMISEVWIAMLSYAAIHCEWKEHAQQLWKGGELLTHVSVVMTHLGLSGQYTEREEFYFI